MNARLFVAGALIAVVLCAAGLWLKRSSHAADPQTPSTAPPSASPEAESGTASLQVPAPVQAEGARQTPPAAEIAPPPLPEVAVEPMLELNAVLAGASAATSVDQIQGPIDDLLGAKYFGQDEEQRARFLRSIQSVLDWQRHPEALDKAQRLSPEALSAFEIEAAWLKEHPKP
jgi:hypothetical protein